MLFPFQKAAVKKMVSFLESKGACYNACEMGLGKSIQAIETCNQIGAKKVLVICPAVVRLVWEAELAKWGHGECRYTVFSYNVATNSIDTLKTADFDTLILDEAHYVKNYKAKRTKAILKHLWPKAKHRICLSGTPFTQSILDCWTIFSRILPGEFGDYHTFANTYTNVKRTPWGDKYEGVKNAERLSLLIRGNFFVRYTKAQVLPDLPAKTWQKIPLGTEYLVKLSPEEEKEHAHYLELLKLAFKEGRPPRAAPPKPIATWRREQGVAKVPAVVEYAKELLDQKIPIVIFTAHKEVLYEVTKALSEYSPAVIEGATSNTDRKKAVERFQKGETNLFVGNFRAAGIGITLTRASHCLLAELEWSPSDVSQAVDRLHRIGQTENVTIYWFCVNGSIDEDVMDTLIEKASSFNEVLKSA